MMNILKALLAVATMQFLLVPIAMASGGSMYHNGIGFTVIGIDDGTWTEINICDSEDTSTSKSLAHCLILKKGSKNEDGYVNCFDVKSGCRLLGKYEEQNFATGNTDDDYMLSQFIAIIKVPKGMRACTLPFKGAPGGPTRRNVTGLYRTS